MSVCQGTMPTNVADLQYCIAGFVETISGNEELMIVYSWYRMTRIAMVLLCFGSTKTHSHAFVQHLDRYVEVMKSGFSYVGLLKGNKIWTGPKVSNRSIHA